MSYTSRIEVSGKAKITFSRRQCKNKDHPGISSLKEMMEWGREEEKGIGMTQCNERQSALNSSCTDLYQSTFISESLLFLFVLP